MKNSAIFILIAALQLWGSSAAVAQKGTQPAAATDYESCCGADPVEYTDGGVYLYVPNVFTPNGDGVNDLFVPAGSKEHIAGFDAYLIYTAEGDTLLFASAGFDPANAPNTAWNGMRSDGSAYKGAFRYEFTVFLKTGGLVKMEGKACRIVCGPDAAVFATKPGCFYPSQVNSAGYFDQTLPDKETGCFK